MFQLIPLVNDWALTLFSFFNILVLAWINNERVRPFWIFDCASLMGLRLLPQDASATLLVSQQRTAAIDLNRSTLNQLSFLWWEQGNIKPKQKDSTSVCLLFVFGAAKERKICEVLYLISIQKWSCICAVHISFVVPKWLIWGWISVSNMALN